jgi:hypothetical protein
MEHPVGLPHPALSLLVSFLPFALEVSWQVTGIRHDPWAEAHRIPVEEVKPPEEQGTYLHPELYGQPEEKSVEWKRLQEKRPQEPVPASASPEKP